MASYNLTKKADRARLHADRAAELEAIKAGQWPRDSDDQFRWSAAGSMDATRARRCVECDLAYLEGIEIRIAAGELHGWEI